VTLTQADCDEHPCELTPGDFLEIRIADTGAGMDEQTQKRIFEPFFTTKAMGKGTGLGLAGVYGCVRSHDGSVSVSSQPGRGAAFTVLLPLGDPGAAARKQTRADDELVRGTGHVLVVDDEEGVRNFVRASLQNLGYTVSACDDGASSVDYYRQHHREIDLVILDLIMPRMNGQDTFLEMKKINPNVKAIVSSGFSHSQATRQILDQGALGLLNKPFQIKELSLAVANHIRRHRTQ
jgi:CheY-like chemotaxis protein